jgi:hypothetical protein
MIDKTGTEIDIDGDIDNFRSGQQRTKGNAYNTVEQ